MSALTEQLGMLRRMLAVWQRCKARRCAGCSVCDAAAGNAERIVAQVQGALVPTMQVRP